MTRTIIIGSLIMLGACTAAQTQQAVVMGQLFCAQATVAGPLVVAVADAAGAPVLATGATAALVKAECAAIGGIPVMPPPSPASAPVVAAPVAGVKTAP